MEAPLQAKVKELIVLLGGLPRSESKKIELLIELLLAAPVDARISAQPMICQITKSSNRSKNACLQDIDRVVDYLRGFTDASRSHTSSKRIERN